MVETAWYIDALRILTIVLASSLVVHTLRLLSHWRTLDMSLDRKLRYLALMGFAIHAVIQESVVLGEPLVIWRFSLLLASVIVAVLGMILPDFLNYWRVRNKGQEVQRLKTPWDDDDHL